MLIVPSKFSTVAVVRLFLSGGHNFFGRHGLPPNENVMQEVDELECIAGCGVVGDRFFNYKPEYKGQITFFSLEILQALRKVFGVSHSGASAARRNVLITGCDLNRLVGRRFEVQGVWFEGTEECRPCYWMDRAFGPGAEAWLRGRGGLRARILTNGKLRRKDLL